jgi:hypothetical protein
MGSSACNLKWNLIKLHGSRDHLVELIAMTELSLVSETPSVNLP